MLYFAIKTQQVFLNVVCQGRGTIRFVSTTGEFPIVLSGCAPVLAVTKREDERKKETARVKYFSFDSLINFPCNTFYYVNPRNCV